MLEIFKKCEDLFGKKNIFTFFSATFLDFFLFSFLFINFTFVFYDLEKKPSFSETLTALNEALEREKRELEEKAKEIEEKTAAFDHGIFSSLFKYK